MKKVAFIGYGNMAKAIINSLIPLKRYNLHASSPSLTNSQQTGLQFHQNNLSCTEQADIIVLSVKPQKIKVILQEITGHLKANAILVSVAAGIKLSQLGQYFPNHGIVRSMPNTPLSVGMGATALIANPLINNQQKQEVEALFQHAGITAWVAEEWQIEAFTALSGSGPAYVFLFMEGMVDAAKKLGLPAEIAKQFAEQTLAGALHMLKTTQESPQGLRQKVTSPGGTTEAAINVLQQEHFTTILADAIIAANKRALELGQTSF